jgi:hypothetical protein
MSKQINFGNATLFLLRREYISECRIEPAIDENGTQQLDKNGEPMDRAVHPMNWSFEMWLDNNNLTVEQQSIIQPNKPFSIIKP